LLYLLFTGIGLLTVDWLKKEAGTKQSIHLSRLLAFLAPVVVLTLPWYIGNWIAYGNPLWPFAVHFKGKPLLEGLLTLDWLSRDPLRPKRLGLPALLLSPYLWLEPTNMYAHDARIGGLGILWIVLGVPSLVYALLTVPRRPRRLWLWIQVIAGGLYLATPGNSTPLC
jgi:hypothetical protein